MKPKTDKKGEFFRTAVARCLNPETPDPEVIGLLHAVALSFEDIGYNPTSDNDDDLDRGETEWFEHWPEAVSLFVTIANDNADNPRDQKTRKEAGKLLVGYILPPDPTDLRNLMMTWKDDYTESEVSAFKQLLGHFCNPLHYPDSQQARHKVSEFLSLLHLGRVFGYSSMDTELLRAQLAVGNFDELPHYTRKAIPLLYEELRSVHQHTAEEFHSLTQAFWNDPNPIIGTSFNNLLVIKEVRLVARLALLHRYSTAKLPGNREVAKAAGALHRLLGSFLVQQFEKS